MKYWKGVNLGNWLVLEKWMNPAMFADTTAEDELAVVPPPCLVCSRMPSPTAPG